MVPRRKHVLPSQVQATCFGPIARLLYSTFLIRKLLVEPHHSARYCAVARQPSSGHESAVNPVSATAVPTKVGS